MWGRLRSGILAAMGGSWSPGMIGRRAECRAITDLLTATRRGLGGALLVGGEAGIGKTLLAETAASQAREAGLTVAWGRCRESDGAPPFWPWAQVLRAVGQGGLGGSPVDGTRFGLFESVTHRLAETAAAGPLLIVLDDLHCADRASARLLEFLASQIWPTGIGLVATFREDELRGAARRAVGQVGSQPRCARIQVAGLQTDEVADWLGRCDPPPAGIDAPGLQRRTGGNPYFIAELLRLGDTTQGDLPDTVRDAVRRRVARLPERTRQALAAAAVLGRDFDEAALSAMIAVGPTECADRLLPAQRAHLVVPDPVRPGWGRFVHVVAQQAIEADLGPSRRADLHGRAFAVLPYSASLERSELAHHACAGVGVVGAEAAYAAVVAAAEDAERHLAWEDAGDWWSRAAELAGRSGQLPPARTGVALRAAQARLRAGAVAAARSGYTSVADVARAAQDRSGFADAVLGLGDCVAEIAPDRELLELLDEALRRPPTDPEQRLRLAARRATATYWVPGGQEDARDRAVATVREARTLDSPAALGLALVAQQSTFRGPDDLPARLDAGTEVLDLARRGNDPVLEFSALQWLVPDRFHNGELLWVQQAVDGATALAEARRDPMMRWWTLVYRGLLAGFAGAWEEAEELAREAEALGVRLEQAAAPVYAVAQLLPILRHHGRIAEAEADLRGAIRAFPGLPTLSCDLALLLAETDRRSEAAALVDRLTGNDFAALPRDSLVLASYAILGEAVIALGDPERAEPLIEQLTPYAARNLIQGVPVGWGSGAWHLARLHRLRGNETAAAGFARLSDDLHRDWGAGAWTTASSPLDTGRSGSLLSPRETDVLRLLATGLPNREIGATLYISVHTVQRHLSNIFRKLALRNRSQATAWALRRGMVG